MDVYIDEVIPEIRLAAEELIRRVLRHTAGRFKDGARIHVTVESVAAPSSQARETPARKEEKSALRAIGYKEYIRRVEVTRDVGGASEGGREGCGDGERADA